MSEVPLEGPNHQRALGTGGSQAVVFSGGSQAVALKPNQDRVEFDPLATQGVPGDPFEGRMASFQLGSG